MGTSTQGHISIHWKGGQENVEQPVLPKETWGETGNQDKDSASDVTEGLVRWGSRW